MSRQQQASTRTSGSPSGTRESPPAGGRVQESLRHRPEIVCLFSRVMRPRVKWGCLISRGESCGGCSPKLLPVSASTDSHCVGMCFRTAMYVLPLLPSTPRLGRETLSGNLAVGVRYENQILPRRSVSACRRRRRGKHNCLLCPSKQELDLAECLCRWGITSVRPALFDGKIRHWPLYQIARP